MTADKDLTTKTETSTQAEREQRLVLRPQVDIFENEEAIKLFADLPGVAQDSLALEVDDNTLTIRGDIQIDMPGDMESLHADVRSTRYQRAFTLSNELDTGLIEASLNDGLLAVTIPKREEVRPRKIEITAG